MSGSQEIKGNDKEGRHQCFLLLISVFAFVFIFGFSHSGS
jgi:hypothetical protein